LLVGVEDLTLQKGLMPQPRGLAPGLYGYVLFLNWYSGAFRFCSK
jgi:hypothetical protein